MLGSYIAAAQSAKSMPFSTNWAVYLEEKRRGSPAFPLNQLFWLPVAVPQAITVPFAFFISS